METEISSVPEQSSAEWLAKREGGIGGSEIGAILGLSPWQSAVDVWLRKTGRVEAKSEETPALHWGHVLEDVVAKEWAERTGNAISEGVALSHGHCRGYTDRMAVAPNGEKILLECKTASAYATKEWGEQGTDKVPATYLAQVQFYLAMLPEDYQTAHIAVLIGGSDFRWFVIQRDRQMGNALLDAAEAFWRDFVETDKEPPVKDEKDRRNLIERLHPGDNGEILTATQGVEALFDALEKAQMAEDEAVAEVEKIKTAIKQVIGDASGIEGVCGRKVTWMIQSRKAIDWKGVAKELAIEPSVIERHTKESHSRVFRFKPAKKEE